MVSGLVLLTFGGFFITHTMAFIVFLLVSGALFTIMFSMNFIYSSLLEGSTSIVALVVVSCVIVAIPITYGIQKLLKKYLICFVGAMVGVLFTMAILQPMSPPTWLRYLTYTGNGVIGFIIFKEAKTFMIRAATATIGAMLFMIGLSMVVAGDTTSNLQF
jgi:hypothetical protein